MKGLDTNVLIRYLVGDDKNQSKRASRFVRSECTLESPCLLNRIVLCELVWVLETAYGYSRKVTGDVLEKILRTGQFLLEDPDAAWSALRAYRITGVDFADCLLGKINRNLGCETTVTFDRKAGSLEQFTLL